MKKLLLISCLLYASKVFAHPGIGIVMDSRKNVYYTDLKQVWKIDQQGKKSVVVKNVHTHELYIDDKDNLYGEHLWYEGEKTDKWRHYAWCYSADGKLEKVIPDAEGFLTDYSFVRDRQGRMYWVQRKYQCQKLSRKNTDNTITTLGDQCFSNIRWMAAASDGHVYLMDVFDLKKVDNLGRVTVLAKQIQESDASLFTRLQPNDPHNVMGLWLDEQQNVYAAVPGGRVVKKISPAGKITIAAEIESPWSPNGGLIGPEGDLWILESAVEMTKYKVRVERILKTGKRIIY